MTGRTGTAEPAAASQPAPPQAAPRCEIVRRYDRWGNVIGYRGVR